MFEIFYRVMFFELGILAGLLIASWKEDDF